MDAILFFSVRLWILILKLYVWLRQSVELTYLLVLVPFILVKHKERS